MRNDWVVDTQLKITAKALDKASMRIVSAKSLLIVARSGILKRILPVSINATPCTVNQDLKVLVPYVADTIRYLQLMLRGHESFILTNLVKTGTTVQSLRYSNFEVQPFPLPPLTEQKRIVAKVDDLSEQTRELADRLKSTEKSRVQLLDAILAQAAL
jgi:type I restriction enzyme S subunit